MRRISLTVFMLVTVVISYLKLAVADEQQQLPKERSVKRSVEAWLKLLASDDFEARDAAEKELLKREDIYLPLHQGLTHPDAEVRRRVQAILDEQKRLLKQKVIRNIPSLAKNGEVERYVDRMVALRSDLPEEAWGAGLDLAKEIWRRAARRNPKFGPFPNRTFLVNKIRLADIVPTDPPSKGKLRIAAIKVDTIHPITGSLVCCRDLVRAWNIADSIILVNGNVSCTGSDGGFIFGSLVCCDGNIEVDFPSGSILIASGSIRIKAQGKECVIVQNEKNPFDFLKRFSLTQIGIIVKVAEETVEITDLTKNSCFAQAGLQKGDRVLRIGGEKPKSVSEFRRLVLKHSSGYQVTTIKVARGEENKEFVVFIKD